jgi:hypothetical protein
VSGKKDGLEESEFERFVLKSVGEYIEKESGDSCTVSDGRGGSLAPAPAGSTGAEVVAAEVVAE